jgi:hypothetical protein
LNSPRHTEKRYLVGLDLGQANDYTALSILKQEWHLLHNRYEYELQYLDRVRGMPYPAIVTKVQGMLKSENLQASEPPLLIIDKTGVGAPVCDLFNPKFMSMNDRFQNNLVATNKSVIEITITSGHTPSRVVGGYHVPKRDLIFALLAIFQSERLKIAEALPLAKPLVGELTNLKLKINTNGHDSYSAWRETEHDDLVLSLALASWYAEYRYSRRPRRGRQDDKNRRRGRRV